MSKRAPLAVAALVLAMIAAAAPGRAEDLAVLSTRAGEVRISEENKRRSMYLGERLVYEGEVYMNIARFFKRKSYDAVLVRDFTGPIYCPIQYYLLVFQSDKSFWLSPPISHCSNDPDIQVKGDRISIHFKPFGSMPGAVWVYDGVDLRLAEQPAADTENP